MEEREGANEIRGKNTTAQKAKDECKREDRCDAILKSLQRANSRCLYRGTKENAEWQQALNEWAIFRYLALISPHSWLGES